MHLTYSSICPLNSYQLTIIIARIPNNIPKSDVDAPIEFTPESMAELKIFPPILYK